MASRLILNPSLDGRELICNQLTDPNHGILLPEEFGFDPATGFDKFGRPQRVNLKTVTDFYKRDIIAADRLFLPESARMMPLFPHQRLVMKTIFNTTFTFIQIMRGGAKTYTVARTAVDYALMFPGVPIVFTGPSFRQALLAYDEVLRILDLNSRNERADVRIKYEVDGDPKRNSTESIVKFANGSSIRALPMGDGSKIRGIRGGVLFLDEFYQMTEEQYESHVSPFVAVMQGGVASKIVYATTSWYQDCFAYKRLLQIASEVRDGNKDYAILDFNLEDLSKDGFPLDPKIWRDAMKHSNPVTMAMTYFNVWPSTSSRWFEQKDIDYAISASHGVKIEFRRNPEERPLARYFGVIDIAASDEGDYTEMLVYRFNEETKKLHCVWGHREKGLKPSERAWLVHETNSKFQLEFIVYDSHAAIGIDLRTELAEKELLVKGTLRKVKPLVHHDAYNITNADRLLIPTAVNDTAVEKALIGPSDGTTIRGEAGFRGMIFGKTRDFLSEGMILGPGSAREIDEKTGEIPQYSGSELEVLDTIREAFNQLGNIGLRRNKAGQVMTTSEGQELFQTRPGTHDDGAMCVAYAVIGYLRMLGRGVRNNTGLPVARSMSDVDKALISEIVSPFYKPQTLRI